MTQVNKSALAFEDMLRSERRAVLVRLEKGADRWTLARREFTIAAVDRYFSTEASDACEECQGQLYDLLGLVQDGLEAARPVIGPLKIAIGDLGHLIRALGRRQPHGDRTISGATLSLIGGVMPRSLRAPLPGHDDDAMGVQFSAMNGGAGLARFRTSCACEHQREPFILPQATGLLSAVAHAYSAVDQPLAIERLEMRWPACLAALGFHDRCEIEQDITMKPILALSRVQRKEMQRLAANALAGLKHRFGIRHRHDPLRINAGQFAFVAPSARLAGGLCDLIAPFPACADKAAYRKLVERESVEGLREGLYGECVRHLRRSVFPGRSNEEADEALRFAGLMTLDPIEHDETRRFLERTIATHRQIALLAKARRRLELLLARVDVARQGEVVSLPGMTGTGVTWRDFHDLGRWCDDLRARLATGSVDPGRPAKLRVQLPRATRSRFPSTVSATTQVDLLLARLVRALQGARDQKLTGRAARRAD
ncbi:MAG: hypothetical protein K2Z25_25800 [Beijerinckiaceae bacterium]|nr:hypothetical protein [Beijerinckiaceae bacterium]